MILFIFEGKDCEPRFYKTLERLYFSKENDTLVCSFENNIYALYKEMTALGEGADIVAVLKEKLAQRGDTLLQDKKSSDFSQKFLFFDYDFQHKHLAIDDINQQVGQMLSIFQEETENGKLYINYPMIESIRYTKELPDSDYLNYVVSRTDCHRFKQLADEFSYYSNFDHLLFKEGVKPSKEQYLKIKDNWEFLKQMNVCKANFVVSGDYDYPLKKSDITQSTLFAAQCRKYVEVNETIAILNSFPLFVYEYLK